MATFQFSVFYNTFPRNSQNIFIVGRNYACQDTFRQFLFANGMYVVLILLHFTNLKCKNSNGNGFSNACSKPML